MHPPRYRKHPRKGTAGIPYADRIKLLQSPSFHMKGTSYEYWYRLLPAAARSVLLFRSFFFSFCFVPLCSVMFRYVPFRFAPLRFVHSVRFLSSGLYYWTSASSGINRYAKKLITYYTYHRQASVLPSEAFSFTAMKSWPPIFTPLQSPWV